MPIDRKEGRGRGMKRKVLVGIVLSPSFPKIRFNTGIGKWDGNGKFLLFRVDLNPEKRGKEIWADFPLFGY
jgi:hypothetical protein